MRVTAAADIPPRYDQILERVALDQLHDEEDATLVLAGIEHGADAGMRERRGETRLPQQSGARAVLRGEIVGQQLDRHVAPQHLVMGAMASPIPPRPREAPRR
jgi:hypothetical protein